MRDSDDLEGKEDGGRGGERGRGEKEAEEERDSRTPTAWQAWGFSHTLGDPINAAAVEGIQRLPRAGHDAQHSLARSDGPSQRRPLPGKIKGRVFHAIAPMFFLSTWRPTDCCIDSCHGQGARGVGYCISTNSELSILSAYYLKWIIFPKQHRALFPECWQVSDRGRWIH